VKFRAVVEFDPTSKRWSAVFPELPGCASAGDSEAEAIANAREALKLWFEPSSVEVTKGAKLVELSLLVSRRFSVCTAQDVARVLRRSNFPSCRREAVTKMEA
jgi:predicted RNase H-like HicB family nuclease